MCERSNSILSTKSLVLLCLPFLLAGCNEDGIIIALALDKVIMAYGLSYPLASWLSQHWLLFVAWALPAWLLYKIGSAGFMPTRRTTATGNDAYGNPFIINIHTPSGPYVPGEPKNGHALAGWWLLVFPLGYVLFPWYIQLWLQADQSTLTPYHNINWHLIKWVLPLSAVALIYWLVRSVVRYKNQALVSRITRAGHWFIWLLFALAAVWPVILLLVYLLE